MIKRFFCALVCLFFSCKEKPQEGIELLAPIEFAEIIKSADVQLIDVRTPQEFSKGKINEAINIDFFENDFKAQIQKLDTNSPIAVYCKSGGRSGKTAKMLKELGFTTIYDLKGGYLEWSKK